uniref:Uncharacterized protein n=1 Tax=uncultured marine virus TaxID=186617 RepID=A0A0F7LBV1_9VIRU|nr:hypothetical protein [uncultured marine virus]
MSSFVNGADMINFSSIISSSKSILILTIEDIGFLFETTTGSSNDFNCPYLSL